MVGPLLDRLPLAGEAVTFGTLFTQRTVAEQIIAAGGAYLMVVKGDQSTLVAACAAVTADQPSRPRRLPGRAHSIKLAHGRREERTLVVAEARVRCSDSAAASTSARAVLTGESVYAISPLRLEQASPATLPRRWTIENGLHWIRRPPVLRRPSRRPLATPEPHRQATLSQPYAVDRRQHGGYLAKHS